MSNHPTDDRDDLVRRIDELTRMVNALEARLERDRPAAETLPAQVTGSRRDMLRLAGTAAAGAIAGTVLTSATPAAATTGNPLVIGQVQSAANITVLLNAGAASNGPGSALSGEPTMFWVDNRSSSLPNANGIRADGRGVNGAGVWGHSDSNGIGVFGDGGFGLVGSGGRAALRLQGTNAAPPARSDAHLQGEIDIDTYGDVWLCVVGGTPGSWRKLGGPSSAGSFHTVNPVRAYDSRWAGGTRISAGENRLISVADGHDVTTGLVSAANVVPARSTGVAYNVTVTGTQGGGFLTVAPGTAVSITASSINWSGDGQNVANAAIVGIDPSRQVRVFAGGSGSTDFVIDVTGYFL